MANLVSQSNATDRVALWMIGRAETSSTLDHINNNYVRKNTTQGLHFQLDPTLFECQYFGRGPEENYPDRKSGSELGVYDSTPAGMCYDNYIVPGENGSRSDCEWIAFRSPQGTGLCVVSESSSSSFSCSAQLYSATELDEATHLLSKRTNGDHPIHVNIDHRMMGVGGDVSWEPVVYPEYLVAPTCSNTAFGFYLSRKMTTPPFLLPVYKNNIG